MKASHGETLDHCGRLFKTGVKLMAGSDCGWGVYPFGHFDRELKAMVDAGLTPTQAIESATSNNAELLGISSDVGTVDAGKLADLIVDRRRPVGGHNDYRQRHRRLSRRRESQVTRRGGTHHGNGDGNQDQEDRR